ncbi:hypothetical protein CC80DRAFT_548998 [Byssothecium circinans]|uniref:Uncharacterized protein n=1 Tax=Byssothecium circinans TaxID=147558 RepID=A0A6A5TU33_9PLEO|nr:hypothetical protein CC80DRAFT_548998 [Byssothecium circinans]
MNAQQPKLHLANVTTHNEAFYRLKLFYGTLRGLENTDLDVHLRTINRIRTELANLALTFERFANEVSQGPPENDRLYTYGARAEIRRLQLGLNKCHSGIRQIDDIKRIISSSKGKAVSRNPCKNAYTQDSDEEEKEQAEATGSKVVKRPAGAQGNDEVKNKEPVHPSPAAENEDTAIMYQSATVQPQDTATKDQVEIGEDSEEYDIIDKEEVADVEIMAGENPKRSNCIVM